MTVVMCLNCGLVATFPGPTENEITEFYLNGFDGDPGSGSQSFDEDWNDMSSDLNELIRHTIPIIEKWVDPKGKDWLEIRFRNGAFLKYLKTKGANVFGADIFQRNIDRAASFIDRSHLFKTAVHTVCEEIELKLDVISGVSIHVLSHLPDPSKALSTFANMLKPDGLLIFEEKDITEIPKTAKTLPLIFPNPVAHYHHFTLDTCQLLFRRNGYRVLSADFIDRTSDLKHFLIIAQQEDMGASQPTSSSTNIQEQFSRLVELHQTRLEN